MQVIRIITSAAYVGQELAVEFGNLPPAFLPIGVSPLYEAQVARFAAGEPIYLTVPEDFQPQPYDDRRLSELNIRLVPVPPDLSLGESIVYAINYIDAPHEGVQILHGDTLIEDLPSDEMDCIAIHAEGDDYSWATVKIRDGKIHNLKVVQGGGGHLNDYPVACGYFALANSRLLIRSITRARGDFIAGLDLYTQERPLAGAWVLGWRDFGHIQTYFRSRRSINTARSFNTLTSDTLTIRKSSSDVNKIAAEAAWLTTVPHQVQPYCVRVFEHGVSGSEGFYISEYQYAPTLSELLVFSSIGRPTWRNILDSCGAFLEACESSKGPNTSEMILADLAITKTVARLERYAHESGFKIDATNVYSGHPMPSLLRIAENVGRLINTKDKRIQTVMHGDFCFSNILYNSRAARISVIDPRGHVDGHRPTCFGDIRYDLAKLAHSIVGCYDFILAGRYVLTRPSTHNFQIAVETSANHPWLEEAFFEFAVGGVHGGDVEIQALTIALFLAMIPLHSDRPDRQAAFIATALRLYSKLDR